MTHWNITELQFALSIHFRHEPPRKIERLTLLKSVHIFKKHRVQYEMRTLYRCLEVGFTLPVEMRGTAGFSRLQHVDDLTTVCPALPFHLVICVGW